MDELQDRLARVGLDVLAEYGFALAGGYALQAHQLVDRMSEDVDMFTDQFDANDFNRAVEAISDAYLRAGFEVLLMAIVTR
jgi:Nucleotidyl transferase AbiEii toxin, Type IV TA system